MSVVLVIVHMYLRLVVVLLVDWSQSQSRSGKGHWRLPTRPRAVISIQASFGKEQGKQIAQLVEVA